MSVKSLIFNFRSIVALASLTLALTFIFKPATADSPADAKKVASRLSSATRRRSLLSAMCFITSASRECRSTRAPSI